MVNNCGGNDLNGSFDILRLLKGFMDFFLIVVYTDIKELFIRF